MIKNDEYFMSLAIKQAEIALKKDEVPIGAIIVKDNKIISKGYNVRESKNDALGHAEIVAIKKACKKLNSWRLCGCKIYVTIEPCLMCAGAIVQSRLDEVIFGSYDTKGGAFGSNIDITKINNLNHYPKVTNGVLKESCQSIIKNYFKQKREVKKCQNH